MRKKYLIITVLCFTVFSACSAQKKCKISISLSDFIFIPNIGENVMKITSDNVGKFNCKDCLGSGKFQYFLTDSIVLYAGEYIGRNDTFLEVVNVINPITLETTFKKGLTFKPVKDKQWHYYNKKEQLVKSEIWDKGLLMESHLYWVLNDSINNIIFFKDEITYEIKTYKLPFLEVIKDGKLFFYDEKKNILKIEKWRKGVLVN